MGLIFSAIAGAIAFTAVGLSAIGFGPGGIAAGSIAAGIQSTIGNVATGSVFAALQSAGASGALQALGVAAGGAAVASLAVTDGEATIDTDSDSNKNTYPTFDSLDSLKGDGRGNMNVKSAAMDMN